VIELEGVTKIFRPRHGDPVRALEEVNLVVKENEFVSLVGPSGYGKSTPVGIVGRHAAARGHLPGPRPRSGQSNLAFAAMLLLAAMAVALFALVELCERLVCPWYTVAGEQTEPAAA
jgi:ABC-type branched-subunit amino acid transport system ATPase component